MSAKLAYRKRQKGILRNISDQWQIIVIGLLVIIAGVLIIPHLPPFIGETFIFLAGILIVVITFVAILGYIEKIIIQQRIAKQRTKISGTTTINTSVSSPEEEARRRFINILSVDFDYIDKKKITNYYNTLFREEFHVEKVVSENIIETTGEAKGKIPSVIESKIGDKDRNRLTKTLTPYEISIEEMFLDFQREMLSKQQVTLGLEKVDIDLSDLNTFDQLIAELKNKFGFEVEKIKLNETRVALRKKASEKTILRLENTTGYVLIQGKFKILNASNDLYELEYDHPVNEYIASDNQNITIAVYVPKSSIEPSAAGNYAQTVGSSILLKIFGNIWKNVARKEGSLELQIAPIAIYR